MTFMDACLLNCFLHHAKPKRFRSLLHAAFREQACWLSLHIMLKL